MSAEAGFTINGTPSVDGSGNSGFASTPGLLLNVQLESWSGVRWCVFEVYDPARPKQSPSRSRGAPPITWVASGSAQVNGQESTPAQIFMPPAGQLNSYVIRATVQRAAGQGAQTFVYERIVSTVQSSSGVTLRKNIPRETSQYSPEGSSDVLADVVEALGRQRQLVVGPPGADGTNGVDGVDGRDGVDGAPGAPGRDGVDGAPGAPGAPGQDGKDGDLNYHHVQGVPSSFWTIPHGLGKRPSITAWDSTGSQVEGDVSHLSLDVATISFPAGAFSGSADCN